MSTTYHTILVNWFLNFDGWYPKEYTFDMAQLLQKLRRDFCQSLTKRMDTLFSIPLGGRFALTHFVTSVLSPDLSLTYLLHILNSHFLIVSVQRYDSLHFVNILFPLCVCFRLQLFCVTKCSFIFSQPGSSCWRSGQGFQRCYWTTRKCEYKCVPDYQTRHSRLWFCTRSKQQNFDLWNFDK